LTFAWLTQVVAVEGAAECAEVWRHLAVSKPHTPTWRGVRPWVLAERMHFVADPSDAQVGVGHQ
jgi:hypothetical protein